MWISVKNTLVFTKQLWVTLLKKCFFLRDDQVLQYAVSY